MDFIWIHFRFTFVETRDKIKLCAVFIVVSLYCPYVLAFGQDYKKNVLCSMYEMTTFWNYILCNSFLLSCSIKYWLTLHMLFDLVRETSNNICIIVLSWVKWKVDLHLQAHYLLRLCVPVTWSTEGRGATPSHKHCPKHTDKWTPVAGQAESDSKQKKNIAFQIACKWV